MKSIIQYIKEKYSKSKIFPMELDSSVKGQEKNKVQNAINKELEGKQDKRFHDESWEGVKFYKKLIDNSLKNIKNPKNEYECFIYPNEGGYRKSKDGMTQWKEYYIDIHVKEHEFPFIKGVLKCFAVGSQDDPFDTYEINITF